MKMSRGRELTSAILQYLQTATKLAVARRHIRRTSGRFAYRALATAVAAQADASHRLITILNHYPQHQAEQMLQQINAHQIKLGHVPHGKL